MKHVSMTNLQLINAILCVAENCCKWRALPEIYENWHIIYVRMNRWSENGVLDRVFRALQTEGIIQINVEIVGLDNTSVKIHPDDTDALKKRKASNWKVARRTHGENSYDSASDQSDVSFSLSSGARYDSPEGIKLPPLLFRFVNTKQSLLMDRACEGDNMRLIVEKLGYNSVVSFEKTELRRGNTIKNFTIAGMKLAIFSKNQAISENFSTLL